MFWLGFSCCCSNQYIRLSLLQRIQTRYTNGEPLRYGKSYRVSDNLQWGYPLHDTSNDSGLAVAGKRKFEVYPEVGARIDGLVDYLLAQDATYADKAQVIITQMEIVGTPAMISAEEQTCQFNLALTLNSSGSGYEDNITITVTAGETETVIPVEPGKETYNIDVSAKQGDEIKAVVSGTQVLPEGVYFYAPKAEDVNGDGIATGREVSQNLVGVAMGETPVYAEDSLELQLNFKEVSFQSGDVSNISYMFLNQETGEVEFLEKIDIDEGETSVPMVTMDGYVSVMFMKQATSGMFWFSEEVDEEQINAAIECLIANNPSYKGHNAIAFGEGAHDLEFKKGKIVTYVFGDDVTWEETVEETTEAADEEMTEETTETATEETVPEETVSDKQAEKEAKKQQRKPKRLQRRGDRFVLLLRR